MSLQSPDLGTGDDYEGDSFRGSGCVEKGFEDEEKSKERGNLGKVRTTRNWFLVKRLASVGLVKSNTTDEDHNHGNKNTIQSLQILQDGFQAMFMNHRDCEGVGCNAENCSKEKRENMTDFRTTRSDVLASDEKISSNGLVKCKSLDRDNKYHHHYNSKGIHVEGNKTSSVPLQMPVEMISGHVSEGKPTRNYDVGSAQNGEKSSSDGEVSIGKKGHQRKRYYAPVEVQSVTT